MGKEEARAAVDQYLKDKLDRYMTNLPGSQSLMAAGWKYSDAWGPGYDRSYRIVIREFARVIHVHCDGGEMARAHLIHKLVEEDHECFPAVKKKLTPKLAYGENQFNPRRLEKMAGTTENEGGSVADVTVAQVRRALRVKTHGAMLKLTEYKETLGDERYEAIIFDSKKHNPHQKYPYTGGAGGSARSILTRIMKTVNEQVNDAITGAVGINKLA